MYLAVKVTPKLLSSQDVSQSPSSFDGMNIALCVNVFTMISRFQCHLAHVLLLILLYPQSFESSIERKKNVHLTKLSKLQNIGQEIN